MHFPLDANETSDQTLVVILKGHLLLEELVRHIISERVKNPKALLLGRFDCYNAICFAQALVGDEAEEALWQHLRALNKIRNNIAHNVEPKNFTNTIIEFVNSFNSEYNRKDGYINLEFTLLSLYISVLELVYKPSGKLLRFDRNES